METNNLEFLDSMSVSQFKEKSGVKNLQVLENPKKDGSLFMVDGDSGKTLGAVGNSIKEEGLVKPIISQVKTPEGDVFFMLHNRRENATVVFTL